MRMVAHSRWGPWALVLCLALLLGGAGLAGAGSMGQAQMEAYELYQAKCLACHDSIADPERPGKTRDGWTVVVKYMDKHYVDLTDAEAQKIIDLLFALRRGLERQPG